MDSLSILDKLVAFPTVARQSNLQLIDYVAHLLAANGISYELVPDPTGEKANLYARIGPAEGAGIVLSGHTDVVSAHDQNWTYPPFELTRSGGLLYGRGTADMKGFVACALSAFLKAASLRLSRPLHLALSYDEEIGCVGVHGLVERLKKERDWRGWICLVGEPTGMVPALGHKGKLALRATCRGSEAHSALAPLALNAIHLGCAFVDALRAEQRSLAADGAQDPDYPVPYSTIHAGIFNAGTALNIVPNRCIVEFEIRNVAEDDANSILDRIRARARNIVDDASGLSPHAAIEIEILNAYPGLRTSRNSEAMRLAEQAAGTDRSIKVAFGTEAGIFASALGMEAVVCGPGFMEQGHKADEYISIEQIQHCDLMLDRLLQQIVSQAAGEESAIK
jgi:acetylornithine deacetylase